MPRGPASGTWCGVEPRSPVPGRGTLSVRRRAHRAGCERVSERRDGPWQQQQDHHQQDHHQSSSAAPAAAAAPHRAEAEGRRGRGKALGKTQDCLRHGTAGQPDICPPLSAPDLTAFSSAWEAPLANTSRWDARAGGQVHGAAGAGAGRARGRCLSAKEFVHVRWRQPRSLHLSVGAALIARPLESSRRTGEARAG